MTFIPPHLSNIRQTMLLLLWLSIRMKYGMPGKILFFAYDCRQHTARSKVKLPPYTVNTLAISETNIYVGMMEGMYIIPQNTLQPSRFYWKI